MNIKDVAAINKTARPIGGKRGKQQTPRSLLDSGFAGSRKSARSIPAGPTQQNANANRIRKTNDTAVHTVVADVLSSISSPN